MELSDGETLTHVRRILMRSRGVDLSGYSEGFVLRALKKRVVRTEKSGYSGYLRLLSHSEEEINEFLQALSINVTEFFRDKGAFEAFTAKVINPLIRAKSADGTGVLRIWSAGCATGQETYTIALCVAQEMKRFPSRKVPMFSVIGTDISQSALAKAKSGFYTESEMKGLPHHLLAEYFVRKDLGYEVCEPLRRKVRFMKESLLDRPSMKFYDAIVCRNVIIYFSRPMHETVMRHLRESLKRDGYLMLGKTESLMGSTRASFDVIDQENRILQRTQ